MVNPLDSGKIIGWATVALPLNFGNFMLLQMKKKMLALLRSGMEMS
jgi:hypothetical protein